jgi:LAS superfamily LD-carboxypeptidase LdcB
VLLLFNSLEIISQTNYSEAALTGRGDLILVGEDYKLQKEAFEAFNTMKNAAILDGIAIEIVSSYRSFEHQKRIWERKYIAFTSKGFSPEQAIFKIIEYSTLPGTSRHHWGTDIDIIDGFVSKPKNILIEKNYLENGIYSKLKIWMDKNSEKYGFYLVYTNDINRKGFKFEPWHYSFKPLSKPMLTEFKKIDLSNIYAAIELKGYKFLTQEFLKKYIDQNVFDINPNIDN